MLFFFCFKHILYFSFLFYFFCFSVFCFCVLLSLLFRGFVLFLFFVLVWNFFLWLFSVFFFFFFGFVFMVCLGFVCLFIYHLFLFFSCPCHITCGFWFPSQGWNLSSYCGSTKSYLLDHQRISSPKILISMSFARVPHLGINIEPHPTACKLQCWNDLGQTTRKTGTQPHPLVDRGLKLN